MFYKFERYECETVLSTSIFKKFVQNHFKPYCINPSKV